MLQGCWRCMLTCLLGAGMTTAQVENMTNKWHIYMTKDGRISLAGLSAGKTEYLAQAIDDSVRNC
jgi:aspartate/tyrosine/aromatic aminotransferase